MAVDDSFRRPGAVPFKWEIRPGVPKFQHQQQQPHKPTPPPPQPMTPPPSCDHHRSSPTPPPKLRPPPGGSIFLPPMEPRTRSFRSNPRTRSERWRFDQPTHLRPDCVLPGCFPSPLLRRKESKRKVHIPRPASEPEYVSDLETLARWSVSSRRSFSPFLDSPSSTSFSSYQSSPRPVSDAEWAGFGLF